MSEASASDAVEDPETSDAGDTGDSTLRRAGLWSAQYVFWLLVLSTIVVATWWSASGSAAFRYAGF